MVDMKNYLEEEIGSDVTLEEHIGKIIQAEKARIFKRFVGKYALYIYNISSKEKKIFSGKIKNLYYYEWLDVDVNFILENDDCFSMYYEDLVKENQANLIIFDTEEEMLLYKEVEGI